MTDLCDYQTYAATLESPPEFCEEEATDSEGRCEKHSLLSIWDRADEAYVRLKEGW